MRVLRDSISLRLEETEPEHVALLLSLGFQIFLFGVLGCLLAAGRRGGSFGYRRGGQVDSWVPRGSRGGRQGMHAFVNIMLLCVSFICDVVSRHGSLAERAEHFFVVVFDVHTCHIDIAVYRIHVYLPCIHASSCRKALYLVLH